MAPGATRAFTSFSEAAVENGNSRIYIGFHFRHAVTEGIKLGSKVGNGHVQSLSPAGSVVGFGLGGMPWMSTSQRPNRARIIPRDSSPLAEAD